MLSQRVDIIVESQQTYKTFSAAETKITATDASELSRSRVNEIVEERACAPTSVYLNPIDLFFYKEPQKYSSESSPRKERGRKHHSWKAFMLPVFCFASQYRLLKQIMRNFERMFDVTGSKVYLSSLHCFQHSWFTKSRYFLMPVFNYFFIVFKNFMQK